MFLPPEVVQRLVHRDYYPELSESCRRKKGPDVAERRRFRPSLFGAIPRKLPIAGVIGAVAGRAARLVPARGH